LIPLLPLRAFTMQMAFNIGIVIHICNGADGVWAGVHEYLRKDGKIIAKKTGFGSRLFVSNGWRLRSRDTEFLPNPQMILVSAGIGSRNGIDGGMVVLCQ
jgi:hypothetical protein